MFIYKLSGYGFESRCCHKALCWKIKKEHIPNDHLLVSFNVKSLVANVLLNKIIQIILNRIKDKNDISKSKMKELLYLCTKVHTLDLMVMFMFRMTVLQWVRQGPFSEHIYGRIVTISNMNSDGQDEVLDKVCRRYSLLCNDIQLNMFWKD